MTRQITTPDAASGAPTPANAAPASTTPKAVWRLDDTERHDGDSTAPDGQPAARLIRQLVLTYTDDGESVVDFDNDATIRAIAAGNTRRYIALRDNAHVADPDRRLGDGCLILLRWPRPTPPRPATVPALLLTCQVIAASTPTVLAILSPLSPDLDDSRPTAADALIEAATGAGFAHRLQILAASDPGHGDSFAYHADSHDVAATVADLARTTSARWRIDILQVAPRRTRHHD